MKLSNYKRLWAVLIVGVLALLLEFAFKQPFWSQLLVTVIGSLIAILMTIDMIKTLRSGKFGVDLLAITAVIATLSIGEYWAALIVLLMLTGGDALEDYAANKANSDLQSLLEKSPTVANQIINGKIKQINIEKVAVGDTLIIRPGEVFPVDGTIVDGITSVNESSLTGEAKPVDKTVGDEVMSGSVNGDTSVTITATQLAKDSQYQNIIRLVKQAESQPARFVRMADRYAIPFTIVSYIIAGTAWYLSGDPVRFAEVLVVASPCPLILAAPIALVAGMSRSSRSGIIVKTGTTIEKLAQVKSFAFDKTGTITMGNLEVVKISPESGISKEQLLIWAASTESQSSHILARSLVKVAGKDLLKVTNVTEKTGAGVEATIGADKIRVGKADFVTSSKIAKVSGTTIYVSKNANYVGSITFEDQPRPEAKVTMEDLHQLGVRDIMMISGDQKEIATQIANDVGIDKVFAESLPEDKINVLKKIPNEKRPVAMVGDGVNDAPSLVTADVGIAMGAHGATAASESADAVILKDDLTRIPVAVRISRRTMRIARESVLIGIFVCIVLMLIASFGVIPAIIGALLQEVVDTITILTALRARHG
ncbi:heavy metal translocating P-type ATPase [Pediococcus claussenii]|uniref:Cd(2+)-exporting ATPase n=1 Tax=Pediococcus claussenii (strain ATCC BAA-344 / DSM 14800 / JCM 18046 / KCTC 3811 / LMG 21948 / P06) TaxID=701521 RepID=G8PCE1_PEDCP|nr:heavy metal translocating P-type ATPase [Pediococcus claussenii]AEV94926.1 cadmium-translocating P-type ATPase [Pediococcus claussenii ATCC BAA-344]ANZ70121.1 cobalt ABC transporter ATP-binding protein [Pediococcus claussenii]ANZ71936.1 cobalt ABC transporter ATP-binding protein [Pediococcus claussenii]KRN19270.1 cadA protein [Pediococcus claussenii]